MPKTLTIPTALLMIASMGGGCDHPARNPAGRVQTLSAVLAARSNAEIEFNYISDVDVDSRGQIYAGDGLAEIVVLDSAGAMVRRLGRLGFGPGEFEAVSTVHLLPGDSLYVYDGPAMRATVYEPQSTTVAYTVRFPEAGFAFPVDVEPTRRGFLLAHFRRINGEVPTAGHRQDDIVRVLNQDGSVQRDTVVLVPEPETIEVRTDSRHGFFFLPYTRQTLVRWSSDGRIYSLWTDSARVKVHGPDGRLRADFTAQLPFPRLPIQQRTIDSLVEINGKGGFPRRTLEEAFGGRWQTWPLVQDMLVDDRSRIWIQPVTQGPQATWLAFDERGQRLATLHLPRSTRPRLIRGERMYAVSTDSLDVESLVVYRLTPSSTRTGEEP